MLASWLLAAAPAFAAAGPGPEGPPHEELARAFLQDHGLAAASPEEVELAEVLEAHDLLVPLGLYDLYVPTSAVEDKREAEEVRDLCASLLDLQSRWLEWIDLGDGSGDALRADLAALRAWVAKWKPAELAKAADSRKLDLAEALAAGEELRAAQDRVRESLLLRGGPLGLERDPVEVRPLTIALAPTRRDFVEFLCFAGWWRPELRSIYWQRGSESWVEFRVEDVHVYAMEYQAVGRAADAWHEGTDVNEKNPRRLQEQIAQLALNQLLTTYYGETLPPSFLGGLALNLVIDLFGEVDTRVDGDLGSRETSDVAVFVPGGASEGGTLPTNEAGSRWRVDKGKYRFVRVLRASQKAGAKERDAGSHKDARFELRGPDGRDERVVAAPLLGAGGQAPQVPAEMRGELLEFLRAYKTAFLFWMRTEAASAAKQDEPERVFARFLVEMARPGSGERFGEVVAEIYGAPLSDPAAGEESLEGRFLVWLAEQKAR